MMVMLSQDAVRQCPVSEQFDWAVEVPFQPFRSDTGVRMVIQCFVDTGDRFHLLQHGADIVADEDNGTLFMISASNS